MILLTLLLSSDFRYANNNFISAQRALKADTASTVIRSATAQLESSVTLCQADAYVPMEGPGGVVTDVSKYHMVELSLAFHVKKKAKNCNARQLIFYRCYVC